MKYFICIPLFFSLFTCSPKTVNYTLVNNSGRDIDSVAFSHAYGDEKIIGFIKKDTVDGLLYLFKGDKDGKFTITLYTADTKKTYPFGSYEKGKPESDSYVISILKDNIIVKTKKQ